MPCVNSPFGLFLNYLYTLPLCQVRQVFELSLLAPPTFKWAFYQLNSWAASERTTSSAIKQAPASSLSCFTRLLLSRPVFPCAAAQLVVLTGLLKLVPRYPLTQHWDPSQSTVRINAWQQKDFEKIICSFFFCTANVFLYLWAVLFIGVFSCSRSKWKQINNGHRLHINSD